MEQFDCTRRRRRRPRRERDRPAGRASGRDARRAAVRASRRRRRLERRHRRRVPRPGARPRQGTRRRGHRARRQDRPHVQDALRVDAHRLRHLVRRRRARSRSTRPRSPSQVQWNLSDSGAVAVILETADHFARFDEVHPELPGDRHGVADRPRRPRQARRRRHRGPRRRDRAPPRARQRRATSPPSSTRRAPPGGRRAACSRTPTSSSSAATPAVALKEIVDARWRIHPALHHDRPRLRPLHRRSSPCTPASRWATSPTPSSCCPRSASFRPTFLLAVPRVFEKVYNSSEQKAEAGGKGEIFRKAAAIAIEHSKALDAGKVPLGLRLQFALFDRLVLLASSGRRWAGACSTPCRARPRSATASGTSTAASASRSSRATASPRPPRRPRSTSCRSSRSARSARRCPGVGVRIADDGEIQVKGINVFDGYWKNEAATAEAMDGAGSRPATSARSTPTASSPSRAARRRSSSPPAARTSPPPRSRTRSAPTRSSARSIVVGDQKPFISALITLDPEMLPVWLGEQRTSRRHDARRGGARTRPCWPRSSAPSTRRTARSRAPSRSASSSCSPSSSPRSPAT